MARDCLIGIDVGTTAIKAVLLDISGAVLASVWVQIATSRPQPGFAEQNPTAWINGVRAALAAFSTEHDVRGLAAIGICSQVNTHTFVGQDGIALMPAITWQDIRCAPEAEVLDAKVSSAQKTAWFGAPVPIDASHVLSRMAHVARVTPAIYAATRNVLLPKDYCVMQLTGSTQTDAIASVGVSGRDGAYVRELLDLVPRSHDLLPPLRPSREIAGRVRAGLPCAGTPVVVGTMDAWAGMFGLGVTCDGDVMYQAGTSEILGIVSRKVTPTSGVVVFPPQGGIVLHAAPTQAGGAALQWFSTVLGITPDRVSALASTTQPSDAVPLFLPHLQGERAPIWDASSRGVFAQIDLRAGAAEMSLSVMEGVAFSARWAVEALEKSSSVLVSSANIGGGGARSDLWCQMRADALGAVLQRATTVDAAAVGAAVLAGTGCGLMGSVSAASQQLVRLDRCFEPRIEMRGYYEDKYARYRSLYETMQPFNARDPAA